MIAPSVLTDFTPLYCEEGGSAPVTQFDKDDVEAAGLVKFDFLGLRTLTIIDWAVRDINAARARAGEPPLAMSAAAHGRCGHLSAAQELPARRRCSSWNRGA